MVLEMAVCWVMRCRNLVVVVFFAWLTFVCCFSCGGSFVGACRCKYIIVVAACRRVNMCLGCGSFRAIDFNFYKFVFANCTA